LGKKNREGKIIVLYDEDEKIAPIAASTLVQRGYDNVFLLSGGTGARIACVVFSYIVQLYCVPEIFSNFKNK